MPVAQIHSYLVHPCKGASEARAISGTAVPLKEGKLFKLLNDIYSKAETECDTEISFNRGAGGSQNNPCRTLILNT